MTLDALIRAADIDATADRLMLADEFHDAGRANEERLLRDLTLPLTWKRGAVVVLVDTFTRSYLETALWSSTGDDDQPLDRDYTTSDFAPEAIEMVARDCAKFQRENKSLIAKFNDEHGRDDGDAGYLFWLNRNGHGHGFWSYSSKAAEALSDASNRYRETDVYLGDDGKLYLS